MRGVRRKNALAVFAGMRSLLVLFFLLALLPGHSQFSRRIFLEAGGSGGLGPVNYESRFFSSGSK